MAHTLTRSYALVQLTINTDTGLAVDDYITEAVSGAVGIIAEITNATTLQVYEMSAVAFNSSGTQVITSVGGQTANCTGTGAGSTTSLPSDCAEVLGTDATVDHIFRHIADISGIGGVTNPTTGQVYLGLEMFTYFGREGQTSDTYAITTEENIRIGDQNAKGQIRLIGSSTNGTTLQVGEQKYKDDDLDNYPPLYVGRGSIIDVRCTSLGGVAINNDVYSSVYWNNSIFRGDGTLNGSNFENYGDTRFTRTNYTNFTGFFSNYTGAKLYIKDVYGQEIQQALFYLPEKPTYSDGIFIDNAEGSNTFFAFGGNWEATAFNVNTYDANGVLTTNPLIATGSCQNVLHCVNSVVDVTKFAGLFNGFGSSIKEISFKITVIDSLGNPVEGVQVELKNRLANALFRYTTIYLNDHNLQPATTTINFTSAHGLAVGDVFRLETEEMLVTSVTDTDTVVVTRGYNGTSAIRMSPYYPVGWAVLAISEKGSTDANGQVEYASGSNMKNAVVQKVWSGFQWVIGQPVAEYQNIVYDNEDMVLTLTKAGYETYKVPIDMSGNVGKDLVFKLKNRRFVEQKSMATL